MILRLAVTTWLVLILVFSGCGVKENDMRRHAVRSAGDDEEISLEVAAALGIDAGASAGDDASTSSSTSGQPATAAAQPSTAKNGGPPKPAEQQTAPSQTDESTVTNTEDESTVPKVADDRPLTDVERRQLTIDRLKRISQALEEYRAQHGRYPAGSIVLGQTSMLSWRVELLPYLGYEDLFKRFRLDEPWDGPYNRELIKEIPDVYQSPERRDEKTNYLAVFGGRAAFDKRDPRWPRDFRDGLEHTALIVEVDDQAAVPWTAPQEYDYRVQQPRLNLGTLREDGFFMIWGGGLVSMIPHDAPAGKVAGMYTIDGDEILRYYEIHKDPQAELDRAPAEDQRPAIAQLEGASADNSGTDKPLDQPLPVEEVRTAPPTSEQYHAALATWRELLEPRYQATRSLTERRELVQEMMGRVDQTDDVAARYVLLTLISQIAAESGEVALALEAVEQLAKEYDVRALSLRADALRAACRSEAPEEQELINQAALCAYDAFRIDDYPIASEMVSVAVIAARRDHGSVSRKLQQLKRAIDTGEQEFKSITRSIKELESDPDNGVANAAVGRYYCFLKDQWDRGLPFLSRADDPELARVATTDLAQPLLAEERVALADDWWNIGERLRDSDRRACHQRAVHWYQTILDQTRTGMAAVKADIRIRESERLYGRD